MSKSLENLKSSFKELKWYEWLMIIVMTVIAARSVVIAFTDPASSSNPGWLTIINFISALCGIFCIFFCAKANISNFIFATVNTIVYAIYLWYWQILGTFYLEVLFYLPVNFITWWVWAKHRDAEMVHKTKSKKLTLTQNVLTVVSIVALTALVHYGLASLAGDSWLKIAVANSWNKELLAWVDSATFSIGIVATILEVGRYKEQYFWWIVTDIFAVLMYVLHFDLVYLTKKTIYLIMAVIGYYNWAKLQKNRNTENE